MRALFDLLRAKDLRKAYAFDVLAGPSAHLRGAAGTSSWPSRSTTAIPRTRCASTGRLGPRTSSARASRPSATGSRAARHASGAGRGGVPRLRRFHAAARGPALLPLRADRAARAPDAAMPASVIDAPARHRLGERHGPERLGLDRGGPRRRAPGERGHAHQRPRRAPARQPARDGRDRAAPGGGRWPRSRRWVSRPRWENGAIRITPSRTLTVRFEPVTTRRVRLVENGPGRAVERGGAVPAGARRQPAPRPMRSAAARPGGPAARGRGTDGAGAPAVSRGDASAARTTQPATTPSPA